MKWILAIFLFISLASYGQTDDSTKYIWYKTQYGQRMPRGWWDSVAHMPYGDTSLFAKPTRPGAIMMHTDKIFYQWSGTAWGSLGGGGSDATKVPLTRTITINGNTQDLSANRTWTLTKSDVGLSNVDNTTDAGKPVSTATQTALNLKANQTALVDTAAAISSRIGSGGLPTQTGNKYKFLRTDATTPTWQHPFEWIDVRTYGAVGDSTTDNTAAIQAAIDAMPAAGGVLYFPIGKWRITSTITVNKTVTIVGEAGPAVTEQTGPHSVIIRPSRCVIYSTNLTDTAIVFNTPGSQIRDISIAYSGGNTARTNIGVYFKQGSDSRMHNVGFFNWGIGCVYENGLLWSANECYFVDHKTVGLKISDSTLNDGGDMSVINCWFLTYTSMSDSATHIYYRSGGGLKILGCKFNGGGSSNNPYRCIYVPFLGSVDFQVKDCSFENFYGSAIYIQPQSGVAMNSISINNNQITSYQSIRNSPDIYLDATVGAGMRGVTINDNQMLGANSAFITDTAIAVKGLDDLEMSGNSITAYSSYFYNPDEPSGGNRNNITAPHYRQTLTPIGGTATWNPHLGSSAVITLTSNTVIVPSEASQGQHLTLLVAQDGSGGHTLALSGYNVIGTRINPAAGGLTTIEASMYSNTNLIAISSNYAIPGGPILGDDGFTTDPLFDFNLTTKRVRIGHASTAVTQLDISADAVNSDRGVSIGSHVLSNAGGSLKFRKSYGTRASPSAAANGNYISMITFQPYDGTSYLNAAHIFAKIDSAVITGHAGTGIGIATGSADVADPDNAGTASFWASSNGNISIGNGSTDAGFGLYVKGSFGLNKANTPTLATIGSNFLLTLDSATGRVNKLLPSVLGLLTNPMTTAGDIIVGGSSGVPARFGLGSANQVLGINNAGTAHEYKTVASGTGISVSNSANTITVAISSSFVTSGTYTPTLTNTTNISASTAHVTGYSRDANGVHVWGEVEIDPVVGATLTELTLSLPIASTLSNSFELAGTAANDGAIGNTARVHSNGSGAAVISFIPNVITNATYSFHFSYTIN